MNDDAVGNCGEESEDGVEDTKDGDGERERGGDIHNIAGIGNQATEVEDKLL